jgi:hypothetical protein
MQTSEDDDGSGDETATKEMKSLLFFAEGADPVDSERCSSLRLNSSWRHS